MSSGGGRDGADTGVKGRLSCVCVSAQRCYTMGGGGFVCGFECVRACPCVCTWRSEVIVAGWTSPYSAAVHRDIPARPYDGSPARVVHVCVALCVFVYLKKFVVQPGPSLSYLQGNSRQCITTFLRSLHAIGTETQLNDTQKKFLDTPSARLKSIKGYKID